MLTAYSCRVIIEVLVIRSKKGTNYKVTKYECSMPFNNGI